MMHIDDWIDDPESDPYAALFFDIHRRNSTWKLKFKKGIDKLKLFCDFDGERWKVTGCSRLGDVWITKDFNRTDGYDKRVDVEDCSNWGITP